MLEPEFKRWLGDTDTTVLVCWDLGHVWDAELYDRIEKGRRGSHIMTGHCHRGCGVVRSRYLTSSWAPDSGKNSYKYPRNYSPKSYVKDSFFMTWEHKAAIRKELAKRAKQNPEEFHHVAGNVTDIRAKFSG